MSHEESDNQIIDPNVIQAAQHLLQQYFWSFKTIWQRNIEAYHYEVIE